jgi:Protein of unknown function, DUF481
LLLLPLALLVLAAPAAYAQQPSPAQSRTDAVRVFLDCNSCDESYIRTEVTFINFVRDRVGADVHVLITTQGTGGGGTEYTLKFIGLGRFQGIDHTLTSVAPQTATEDERRAGLTSVFKLGLVRYVADTPLAQRLTVTFEEPPGQTAAGAVDDPWNFWVFRVGASGDFESQESSESRGLSASFSANRTTEMWKINFNGSSNYDEDTFELEEEDGGTFTSVRRNSEFRALVTKSINEHWSYGGTAIVLASTFQNYDLRTRTAPGIEYNIFPYSESTRRILTLFYSVGYQTADYTEETIFGKTSEQLYDHSFEVSMALRQPWGTASGSLEVQQYLNRSDTYRVNAFGSLDVRLFKGFSLEVFGSGARRRDQLSLRRGEATSEEILVRQRELATGYQIEVGFGFSYSFGSIFNNVVNPRFRNVGGL